MNLTTRGRYGIRAISYIGENATNKPVPLSQIAEDLNLSDKYLEQLLRLLKRDGIITSQRGAHGGYYLNRPSNTISLREIINSLEGESFDFGCVDPSCNVVSCPTKGLSIKLEKAISSVIDNYTLDDLINDRLEENNQKNI